MSCLLPLLDPTAMVYYRGQIFSFCLVSNMNSIPPILLTIFFLNFFFFLIPLSCDRNSPELGFGVRYPCRDTQRQIFRWLFVISYLLQGALFSAALVQLSPDKTRWVVNVFSDIVLVLIFLIYCSKAHVQSVSTVLLQ